jgi:hypothetical protein
MHCLSRLVDVLKSMLSMCNAPWKPAAVESAAACF